MSMRRAVFYLVYDKDGVVGDYVLHHLRAMRDHAEHIFVVSNSPLSDAARASLEDVADTVWVRDNVGYDVWAYRDAMRAFGDERIAEFDEIVLMNYTFYGPIGSYDGLFADMDAREDVDFWGVTDHAEIRPNPYTYRGVMHRHIQSHWIAVRRRMLASPAWSEYWADMPPITSYADSVQQHEARLTHHFEQRGFRSATAFPASSYPVAHPIFDAPALLLDDGLPIIKRRLFFHDPLHLDAHAIVARDVADRMRASGYPMELLHADMARTAKPQALHANLALMEVLPDVDLGGADVEGLRVGVLAHVYYDDMVDEIVDRVEHLPSARIVATTSDEGKRARIEARLRERGRLDDEVRVLPSNRGRDISAFLLGCRDVLLSDEFDIIVKLHTKKSPQDGYAAGTLFKRHLYENLLSSPGYARNLLRLFVDHPSLGMVFPPMIHIGFPTMGRAWFANREPAIELMERLGMDVPIDDHSPVAPFGSMFVARPAALRSLATADLAWIDFPDEGGYADGGLAHTLERLFGYSAIAEGMHVRTVMTTRNAAISHTALEHKLGAMTEGVPGDQRAQVHWLRGALAAGGGSLGAMKVVLAARAPRLSRALRPGYVTARAVYRRVRRR